MRGLEHPERHPDREGEQQRDAAERDGDRCGLEQEAADGLPRGEALAEVAPDHRSGPACILDRERAVEPEVRAQARGVVRRRRGRNEELGGIAGRHPNEHEDERDDEPEQHERIGDPSRDDGDFILHALNMRVRARTSIARVMWAGLAAGGSACVASPRPADVVVYASGTDLESGNPLVTIHPLSRQVQRFALFTTLARYDSALAPEPYAARSWTFSADRRALTFTLARGLRWHDGTPTTSRDVAFTLLAARDPRTGYARVGDLASLDTVTTPGRFDRGAALRRAGRGLSARAVRTADRCPSTCCATCRGETCGVRRSTSRRWETAPSGSWSASPASGGCSSATTTFQRRSAARRASGAS